MAAACFLDDKLIIDAWRDSAATTYTASVDLKAGQAYPARRVFSGGGDAVAQLRVHRTERQCLFRVLTRHAPVMSRLCA